MAIIINGGSRENGGFFAKHLMRADTNERVEVKEIRGVCGENIRDALHEMEAVASGTRTKNYFYHANINPEPGESLNAQQWREAVDRLERNLGLTGQPRVVVEHLKEGRTHQHVIWSRIDLDSMKAISDSQTAKIHERTSRELEITFELARGKSILVADREGPRPERRPEHFAMIRGKAAGIDPRDVKAEVSALYRSTDTGKAFVSALQEAGYVVAQGTRRDFVIFDGAAKEHSIARRIEGGRADELRQRMADVDRASLPTFEEGRERAKALMAERETARGSGQQAGDGRQAEAAKAERHRADTAEVAKPSKLATAAHELARSDAQKDFAATVPQERQPAPIEADSSVKGFQQRQAKNQETRDEKRRDDMAARGSPSVAARAESAAQGMEKAATRGFDAMCKTGEKVFDLVSGAADFFFATPRTVTAKEAAASAEAAAEFRAARLFEVQRERAYDRMAEERAAGKHLTRDDVRYLSEADRANYRMRGDAALDQMFRDREREQERERGGRHRER